MDDCVSVAGTVFAGSQISVDVIWPAGAAIELGMSAYFEMGWVGLVRFVRLSRGHCSGQVVASNWVDLVTSGKRQVAQKKTS